MFLYLKYINLISYQNNPENPIFRSLAYVPTQLKALMCYTFGVFAAPQVR
jgi:hypothetical protein